MIDTVFIGMSGLSSYSKGLKAISNNVTNLNTPGFKTSQLQFTDLFYQGSQNGTGAGRFGNGVGTNGTNLNFMAGDFRSTGNELDVAVNGQGFFVLRDEQSNLRYTKAGQFEFNGNGVLVNRNGSEKVMAYDAGNLREITLQGMQSNPPKATSEIVLKGNLSPEGTQHSINNVAVFDSAGKQHNLTVAFTDKKLDATTGEVSWTVTVKENATTLTTGDYKFKNSLAVGGSDALSFSFNPAGAAASTVTMKLGPNVQAFNLGTTSSLEVDSKDGYGVGTLAKQAFDDEGHLVLNYSNGQSDKRYQLAMARFSNLDSLEQMGSNQFQAKDANAVSYTVASKGQDAIRSRAVEISNVDLSQEFSDLILNQRGYQASSQIVSTANEMIQELFEMKGRR
ncbi:flagellar basal-body rod protein FlgF [Chitinimonas sp. BJB300]|uniref:flagellar basal-body rod protein FlgF n=1 Tax=Chitinimonas sp. BJB300 TaxID=1559339 RepID=UPI000C1022B9|nr:flagellar basal-body rod protein FlgF [Chitinimonas sp. BJB300]PHV12868.1 flagellar basal-body rod protein FlgF [Chitinimonas sp. BJB300]TSJ86100.1 flagellar basal-body rod protein FlgF [Chitinimonas sp. BJB300]